MKSTPIVAMEKILDIQTLKDRRDTKVMVQSEKFLCIPHHPMKNRFQDLAMGRLKRSSFIHQAKRLRRQMTDLPEVERPLTSVPEQTPWREGNKMTIHIQTQVPGILEKEEQNSIERKTATLSFLDDEYPQDCWIRVYTDGSAQDTVKNGGAGVYIEYPNNNRDTAKIPTGKFCHNYDAEIQAIIAAAKKLLNTELGPHPIVFLTDARSVLQALQARKLPDLQTLLSEIHKQCRVTIQWIPSHCGIPGNEKADRLAKEGAAEAQPEVLITYQQKKNIIKSIRMGPAPTRDEYHDLSRPEQVIILRLRTGHNRLRYHMHTKLKMGNTAMCTCGQAPQTAEHILQECPTYERIRRAHWPSETSLKEKLYGPKYEQKKTALFIQETELLI